MSDRIRQKWRPPLALVIGGAVAAVLIVPLFGVGYFRLAGNILGWAETSWLLFWMAVLASLILGFLLWRLVLTPVWSLTDYARAVTTGQTDRHLPPHFGTPEITDLARAVKDMQTTLQDRETGLRAYTDHVTHELKTPLTSISGAAELLSGDLSDEDRQDLVSTISGAARQMDAQLGALRRFAAARDPLGSGPCVLSEVSAQARMPGVTVKVETDGALPLSPEAATAVLTQLIQNARDHGAKTVTLSITGRTLIIRDDGAGIAAGDADRIFDPFFTTRRETGGTGMGLSIVRRMLAAEGAKIALGQSENGAEFLIAF